MGAAELQTTPESLTDQDIQILMEHAGQLLLDPRIEPLARQLQQRIDHYSPSPLTLPITLAMLATSIGLSREVPTLDTPVHEIQARVAALMEQRRNATPRTIH